MAEAKLKRIKRRDGIAIPVVRDSTFHRAVVDNALVIGVGSEVEIACLQNGLNILSVQTQSEGLQLDTADTQTEVVRLRFSWTAATALAMNILASGIAGNKLDGTAILDELASMGAKGSDDDI